jgi:hypothetical protein
MTRSVCLLTLSLACALSFGCDSQTASKRGPVPTTANSANDGTPRVKDKSGMKIKKGPDVPKAMPPMRIRSDN